MWCVYRRLSLKRQIEKWHIPCGLEDIWVGEQLMLCGPLGGIVVMWDTRAFQLLEMEEGAFTISCLFKNWRMGCNGRSEGCIALVWAVPERDYGKS